MAVAYRSVATTTLAARTNTTATKPSGTADNDILIFAFQIGSDITPTPPSGLTQIGSVIDETLTDLDLYIYWKRASSEGADYTFTHANAWSTLAITAISGAVTSGDPQDATMGTDNDDGNNTTLNIPSITTATNNSLVLAVSTEYNTGITGSTPAGWDERADVDGVKVWTKTQASAGATGATSSTLSGSSYKCTAVIAIKEADATNIDTVRNPEFVAAGAQTVTLTTGATLSPALPTGWAVGDLLVMQIAGRCNGSTITNTFSNTWNLADVRFREIGTGATDLWVGVYYKYAEAGEASPTVTPDADFLTSGTTGGVSAQIAAFRYVMATQDATAVTNDAAAAATWTPPAITTNTPNALVLTCVATSDDNALNFNTANSFSLAMSGASYDTTTGSDHAVGMGYYVKPTAGLVTMPIWNESAVGNDPWVGVTVAFRRKVSMPPYAKRPLYIWRSKNQ